MSPSLDDCLNCRCTRKQAQAHLNVLAEKAARASTLDKQEQLQRKMMTLADCMDLKPGKSRGWLLAFVAALIVGVIAWVVLTRVVGKVSSVFNKNDQDGDAPLWTSSVMGALLAGALTFFIVYFIFG